MVCSFLSTDCRLWVNAFSFLSLDRYMREARNGIPIWICRAMSGSECRMEEN